MKKITLIVLPTLLFFACNSTKNTVSPLQRISEANQLATQGAYTEALAAYASMANRQQWDSATYRLATICAGHEKADSLARLWGRMFPSTGDAEKLATLDNSLARLGKTGERIELIEANQDLYASTILGTDSAYALLATHYAATRNPKLNDIYPKLKQPQLRSALFGAYFKSAQNNLSADECSKLCKEILTISPNDVTALAYLAKTTYDKAEKKYVKTMDDYNKNKTQAAYAYMTRDLKRIITPMYKESRDYFEKLRTLEPDNKNNIKYLINIYRRLDNKQKVKDLEKALQ